MKRIFSFLLVLLFVLLNIPVQGQLDELEPSLFWSEFSAIAAIFRPSGSEHEIKNYIVRKAIEFNLETSVDGVGNLIVKMPATPGCEKWPGYILQGHLDMVCLARPESGFVWGRDVIEPYVDEGWLKARRTTLGADNGVGLAAMLYLMSSPPVRHGPVEFLFTVDEEGDFSGVCGLKPGQLNGKYLLNLDSEESGEFNVGCAGGQADSLTFSGARRSYQDDRVGFKLILEGGRSGHSGVDIHRGRANCLAEIVKLMRLIVADMPVNIVDFKSGETDTAIPGSAEISFYCQKGSQNRVKKAASRFLKSLRNRYKYADPDLNLILAPLSAALPAMSESCSKKLIECLYEVPAGILAMSRAWPGNVQTSINPGVIRANEEKFRLIVHLQGSTKPVIKMLSRRISLIAQKYGALHQAGEPYEPWEPGGNDELIEMAVREHVKITGNEPLLKVVHAGVECGEIKKKFEKMQMLSFGPDIRHAHSTEEKLRISSIKPFLELIEGLVGSEVNN